MARRSEHSLEEIKEMVLSAAETIVVEDGFGALKVRQIAMEIGYTVGSIYMVFENMGDLITHLKARTLDDIAVELDKVITNDADPQEQLIALSKAYANFANQHFNRWSMIFEHRSTNDAALPDWYQQKINEIFKRVEVLFKQLAPQSTQQQQQQAAQALWSGIHGVCQLSLTGKLEAVGENNTGKTVLLLAENFIKGWQQIE
ncbi:MAG: TetR family transcriptional regulator [Methylococcaceae bacterium]|nr:TetR family transcriptional regulator [Methylococcaceae bacterium]